MSDRAMQAARAAAGNPRRAVLFALAAAVLAAVMAFQLDPASPQRLLAKDGSEVGAATRGQERAFGAEPVVVVLEGDVQATTLTPEVLPKLLTVEQRLAELDGVQSVIGPATFVDQAVGQMFKVVEAELGPAAERADKAAREAADRAKRSGKFTAAEVESIREETRLRALGPLGDQYSQLFVRFGSVGMPSLTNAGFVNQLVLGASPNPKKRFAWLFPDRDHALVLLRPRAGLSDAALGRLGEDAARIVREARLPRVETSVAGAPLVVAKATSTVADELLRLAPVVLAAMALALLLGLGRRNRALHLLLPAGLAVLLTAALSWPLGLGFSAATLAALPVVLGLALDYAVQLQARYWTERAGGLAPEAAVLAALRRVGPTLALAGVVMAIGFLALLVSPVPLVGRLGLTLALGVACSLVCLVLVAVPLLVLTDRPGSSTPALPMPRRPVLPLARLAAVGAAIALIGSGLVLSNGTDVESDLRRLADRDMPELQRLEDLQRELGTGGQIRVAVTGGKVTDVRVLEWMAKAEQEVLALDPRLKPGPNLATILGSSGQGLPSQAAVERLLELIPTSFVAGIVTQDRERAELNFGIPLTSAGDQVRLIERMQGVLDSAPAGVDARAAGLQALSAASVDDLQGGRPWLLLLAALLVFLVLAAVWRDPVRAAIPLAPAFLTAGTSAVVLAVLDIKISPLSAGLDPLVLAVGVEFGLLLDARYREERRDGHTPDAAARRTRRALGTPVAVAAGTVALGFAVLAVSRLPVLQEFGIAAALELVLCVIAAIAIVPALASATDRAPVRRSDAGGAMPVATPDPRVEALA